MATPALRERPSATTGNRPDSSRRVVLIDALRGFALFGILLMHALVFAAPGGPPGFAFDGSPADRAVMLLALLLIDSKFFSIFTFLFGVSFALQLQRHHESRGAFRSWFARRLLVLLALGAAHVLLLWEGDILILYALVGFMLLGFVGAPQRAVLRWSVVLLTVPAVVFTLMLAGLQWLRLNPDAALALAAVDADILEHFAQLRRDALTVQGSDSFGAVLARRLESYASTFALLLVRAPMVLGMFLLGWYAARVGVIHSPDRHGLLLRNVAIWGGALGLVTSGLVVLAQWHLPSVSALLALTLNQSIAGPLLGLAYAAAFVLFLRRAGSAWLVRSFAAVGRMSLTNYLTQSLFLSIVFYGYGFGLVGRTSAAQSLIIAVVIYAVQVALSIWWLRRFPLGPLEWLWRAASRRRDGVRERQ